MRLLNEMCLGCAFSTDTIILRVRHPQRFPRSWQSAKRVQTLVIPHEVYTEAHRMWELGLAPLRGTANAVWEEFR
jgi:hypothetical protein